VRDYTARLLVAAGPGWQPCPLQNAESVLFIDDR
jgi:hypothetical protein